MPNTTIIGVLKTLCKWLYNTDQLPTNPIEKVLPPQRQKEAEDFNWEEGTVVVLGKGNHYRKALAGNGIARDWFTKHESLGITADGISTILKRLGKATGIHCNAHSFRRGFCVHNVKSGLSNKVIQSLGGWESPDMVSHYAASLTFDDALQLYRKTNNLQNDKSFSSCPDSNRHT